MWLAVPVFLIVLVKVDLFPRYCVCEPGVAFMLTAGITVVETDFVSDAFSDAAVTIEV